MSSRINAYTMIKLITVVIVAIKQTTYILFQIAIDSLIDNLRIQELTTAQYKQ